MCPLVFFFIFLKHDFGVGQVSGAPGRSFSQLRSSSFLCCKLQPTFWPDPFGFCIHSICCQNLVPSLARCLGENLSTLYFRSNAPFPCFFCTSGGEEDNCRRSQLFGTSSATLQVLSPPLTNLFATHNSVKPCGCGSKMGNPKMGQALANGSKHGPTLAVQFLVLEHFDPYPYLENGCTNQQEPLFFVFFFCRSLRRPPASRRPPATSRRWLEPLRCAEIDCSAQGSTVDGFGAPGRTS